MNWQKVIISLLEQSNDAVICANNASNIDTANREILKADLLASLAVALKKGSENK